MLCCELTAIADDISEMFESDLNQYLNRNQGHDDGEDVVSDNNSVCNSDIIDVVDEIGSCGDSCFQVTILEDVPMTPRKSKGVVREKTDDSNEVHNSSMYV